VRAGVDAELAQQLGVAEGDAPAVDRAGDTATRARLEVRGLDEGKGPGAGSGDDRGRQRVLTALLEAGGEPQELVGAQRPQRLDSTLRAGDETRSGPHDESQVTGLNYQLVSSRPGLHIRVSGSL
jgi:hypothetical protein